MQVAKGLGFRALRNTLPQTKVQPEKGALHKDWRPLRRGP